MKIIVNSIFKNKIKINKKVFFCQIGKNKTTAKYNKKEGDKCTPIGKWKINNIFLREDKKSNIILKKKIKKKVIFIKKSFRWCDDSNSPYYNKLIKRNSNINFSCENLYRSDDVYDIIIDLNYNKNPTIKNKGSAIFLHCSFDDLRSTNGCLALKKNI